MSSNRKGDRRERELVNALDEEGFTVMRAPASGSATEREQPDVLAGNGDVFYAIEVKSSAGDPIYLTGEEVFALRTFGENFGAVARIGVRFDREDWSFFHPDDLHTTDGGNYRVKLEDLPAGETIADLGDRTDDPAAVEETVRKVLRAVDAETMAVDDAVEMLVDLVDG